MSKIYNIQNCRITHLPLFGDFNYQLGEDEHHGHVEYKSKQTGPVLEYRPEFHCQGAVCDYVGFWPDSDKLQMLVKVDEENKVDSKLHLFHKNGSVAGVVRHSQGEIEGRSEYWHDNGQMFHFGHYLGGLEHRTGMFYDPDGELKFERFHRQPTACSASRALIMQFLEHYEFTDGFNKLTAGLEALPESSTFTKIEAPKDLPTIRLG